VTGLDVIGLPVWQAIRPLGRSLSVSQGKGATPELAAISALMESVEIDHAETHGLPSLVVPLSRYAAMPEAVSLLNLPLRIDAAPDPDQSIEVIETQRLSDGAAAILPRAVVDLDYTVTFPGSELLARSSNGLASGNGRNETLVHAICEAVERDGVSSWYLGHALRSGTGGTRVELSSVDDPWCREQLDRLKAAGLDLIVWHATGRVALPTFVASLIDRRGSTPYRQRASGYGCHVDAGIALSRAINEAAQSRLTAISGSRDDNTWAHYMDALPAEGLVSRTWWASVSAEVPSVDFRSVSDAESFASTDLSRILAHIRDCLANAGLDEVYVTDLGRPGPTRDAGFAVLHVSVPGLQVNARKFHTLPDPARLAEAGLAELEAASAAS
jgi:ribosomal protein S12 methylthiotransferase accessory factor